MSERRQAANRRNALKSTGPKTPEGKARASMNALKHGLRAVAVAVPNVENVEDWEAHRDLVIRDLAPAGYLETILSERVAVLLWRLGRVVRYESAVVSNEVRSASVFTAAATSPEEAQEAVDTIARVRRLKPSSHVEGEDAGAVLELVRSALDLDEKEDLEATCPKDHDGETWGDWDGWTRGALDEAVQSLKDQAAAEYAKEDPWELAARETETALLAAREAHRDHEEALERERRAHLIPEGEVLDKVSRYETALERSLFKTVHELQRLQAARTGGPLLPPAAVDVDVDIHREA